MKTTIQFLAVGVAFSLVATSLQAQDPPATTPPVEELPVPQNAAGNLPQDPPGDQPAVPGTNPPLQQDGAARPQMGVMLGQSAGGGVLITDVRPGGPAYNAGLRRGDYLLKVGNQDVSDPNAVAEVVAQEVVDDRLQLVIWRDARRQDWTVDLRNAGPPPELNANARTNRGGQTYQDPYYYDNRRSYDRNRYYYGNDYRRSRLYNDPAYRFGYYYDDPYRGWNNRYTTGRRGLNYGYPYGPYGGNGLYLNGRGRSGLQIGGFGINW